MHSDRVGPSVGPKRVFESRKPNEIRLFEAIDVRPSKPWVGGSNPSWITMKRNPATMQVAGYFCV